MAPRLPNNGYLLGLDVGDKRIGVALASVIARLPQPLKVIPSSDSAIDEIKAVAERENVTMLVVGLPRNMQGQETAQTQKIRSFAERLDSVIDLPVVFADESLSSKRAEELIRQHTFKNASQDSLAACFILEEFFNTNIH